MRIRGNVISIFFWVYRLWGVAIRNVLVAFTYTKDEQDWLHTQQLFLTKLNMAPMPIYIDTHIPLTYKHYSNHNASFSQRSELDV